MSSASTTINEFQQGSAPSLSVPTRPFYWSVRRELWEYRSIYVAPLVVAVLILIGFLIGAPSHVVRKLRVAESLSTAQIHEAIVGPYNFAAMMLMGVCFLVSIFYCIEAMQGERRDRSILFWKSLPLSDVTVVLSKMSVPLVILPVIAVALTIVTHIGCLVLSVMALKIAGVSAAPLWIHLSFPQMWAMMAYHMLVLHGLWFAPFYAWMLLVSAWARRLALLWAVLPFVALGMLEKITFNTAHFGHWMLYRLGGAPGANAYPGNEMAMHAWMHLSIGEVLFSPSLWTGLIAAALFLWLAARVRRNRGPI